MQATYGFSFTHGGQKFDQSNLCIENGARVIDAGKGLKVTSTLTEYPNNNTRYWVQSYENTGDTNTDNIADIYDAEIFIRFDTPYQKPRKGCRRDYFVTLTSFVGADCGYAGYGVDEHEITINGKYEYAADAGRSCNSTAPYFVLNHGTSGVVIGLGWTGQWKACFEYTEEGVIFRYGVEKADFYLKPGEKVRTGSILITEYEDGKMNGHNNFRRVIKERCVLGKGERAPYGKVGSMTWGSASTEAMLKHIEGFKKYDVGVECYFVDAGWFGYMTEYAKSEHECDWYNEAGNWVVNPVSHPDGLEEVAKKAHEAGMDFLLWFEPERASVTSDWVKAHPDYVFEVTDPPEDSYFFSRADRLVNLGHEGAWQMVFDMLCGHIERLDIQWYRQDFNMHPLLYWRTSDEEGRVGLAEIKHINGLYRLYDALLERFPKLLIDNCAAGGTRNDIEMMFRSMPLWRSDLQCAYNAQPEYTQAQGTGINWILPYSGTGVNGPMTDTYEVRSCYGASLSTHTWWWTEDQPVVPGPELDNARKCFKEYKKLRPVLSCDYYPLTDYTYAKNAWCVWQFNDPENARGAIMAFRRQESIVTGMSFMLHGVDPDAIYTFRNIDTGETADYLGKDLWEKGFNVSIFEKRSSTIYVYGKKDDAEAMSWVLSE